MPPGKRGEWETSDLGSAAYAHSRGLAILGVDRARRGPRDHDAGKFTFKFKDPESKGPQLQLDYFNSDCRKFDEAVRTLKKLCYDGVPARDSREG